MGTKVASSVLATNGHSLTGHERSNNTERFAFRPTRCEHGLDRGQGGALDEGAIRLILRMRALKV